jgi:Family of unknown function (DUF5361)
MLEDIESGRLSLRVVLAMVKHAKPDSAIYRAVNGVMAAWSMDQAMLARISNSLSWLVWAKTDDGQHNRNRPKPILPPWLEEAPAPNTSTFGRGSAVPKDEFWARWHEGNTDEGGGVA